jgi:hypothetical protein
VHDSVYVIRKTVEREAYPVRTFNDRVDEFREFRQSPTVGDQAKAEALLPEAFKDLPDHWVFQGLTSPTQLNPPHALTNEFFQEPRQGIEIHELSGVAVILCAPAERAGKITVVCKEEFDHFRQGNLASNNLPHLVAD